MAGSHSMWSGLGESVNTFFVQLEERVTVRAAVSTAEQLGVRFRADAEHGYALSLVLRRRRRPLAGALPDL